MRYLTKRTDSLTGVKSGLLRRIRESKSLSAPQILEALIAVADEADKKFVPEMLDNFWRPFEGTYGRFVRDISASFGLNERQLYDPHEPFSGDTKQHHMKAGDITMFVPHLQIVNKSLLNKMKEDDEILLVSYHIGHFTSESTQYFDHDCVHPLVEWYLRIRGFKEASEVAEEMVRILKPHQINSSESPLKLLAAVPWDVCEYQQRMFTLSRRWNDFRQNDGDWVTLLWAFGVYTRWPEPIGYIQFNKEFKEKRKLFLPYSK